MFPVHAQTVKLSCLNVFTLVALSKATKVEQKQAKNKNKTNKQIPPPQKKNNNNKQQGLRSLPVQPGILTFTGI